MENKQFFKEIEEIFKKGLTLIINKNSDYGAEGDPFKNFNLAKLVDVPADRAILVRITDKLSRISNLLDKPAKVEDEKLEDTILDLINYAAILLVYINNNK